MINRSSGLLVHISSLPSDFGIGDFGPNARQFVFLCAESGQKYWQILPLNPTEEGLGNSPYSSVSAFAINKLFVSPEDLYMEGLLLKKDLTSPALSSEKVDYQKIYEYKEKILARAYVRFKKNDGWREKFNEFLARHASWLPDYALFVYLKQEFDFKPWNKWPDQARFRDSKFIADARQKGSDFINYICFQQFIVYYQWYQLRAYATRHHVKIIGDIPIYVNYDSVDVWTNPKLFKLDENLEPQVVAGVPPDYFSETGQRWGNPVYDWRKHQEDGFSWWLKRLEQNFRLFDVARIDHFRGLVQFWEIPSHEKTAINGKWADVPIESFLNTVRDKLGLPIIAEDLGIITDDVKAIMQKYDLPGMKILLFAFSGDLQTHPYLPHNYVENCVVYTGTHDNNTVRGWWEDEASDREKMNVNHYVGRSLSQDDVAWAFIVMSLRSKARLAIHPLQDVLGLDSRARMNIPSTTTKNWQWRFSWDDFDVNQVISTLRDATLHAGRIH